MAASVLDLLAGRLVVSCQPVKGGPLDRTDFVVAMAEAAAASGAAGLRIEGVERVAATVQRVDIPVIGIVKYELADYPVQITPFVEDVNGLAAAGAALIAFDATDRRRPVPLAELTAQVVARGCLAMADCATVDDARAAVGHGCAVVGSTMSGYTGGIEPKEPDLELVRAMAAGGMRVMAEGRIRTPEQAQRAIASGAWSVTVGSAITRIEYTTEWFSAALETQPEVRSA